MRYEKEAPFGAGCLLVEELLQRLSHLDRQWQGLERPEREYGGGGIEDPGRCDTSDGLRACACDGSRLDRGPRRPARYGHVPSANLRSHDASGARRILVGAGMGGDQRPTRTCGGGRSHLATSRRKGKP